MMLENPFPDTPEAMEALETLGRIWEEQLRKQFNISPDWVYRVGYTSDETWNKLIEFLGPEMLITQGSVRRKIGNKELVHFSIFISPKGMKKVQAEAERIIKEKP